jgi:hypothetical protein
LFLLFIVVDFWIRDIPGLVRKKLGFEIWNAFVDMKEPLQALDAH